MSIGVLTNGNTTIYFPVPITSLVMPAVYRIETQNGELWSLGGIDFTKCERSKEQPAKWTSFHEGSAFWPASAKIIKDPHWSDVAMVNLAVEQYAKILASQTPPKLALLAATDLDLYREFDKRKKNWRQDLLILAQCLRWEETDCSMAHRYADCESIGIKSGSNASIGAAWLQKKIDRLKDRLTKSQ